MTTFTALMAMYTWQVQRIWFALNSLPEKYNVCISDRGLKVGSLIVAGTRMLLLGQSGEMVIAQINSEKFQEITRDQVIGGKCWTMPSFQMVYYI